MTARRIELALRGRSPGLVAYVTGGFPDRSRFLDVIDRVASVADVIEVGVPFSDPMADGVTLQRASRIALEGGASLKWLLSALRERSRTDVPVLLMGYVNPFLQHGFDRLADDAAEAGVSGFIVPDLPLEESRELATHAGSRELALVQLVTPVTPEARLRRLASASGGFVYAVTMTGITGAALGGPDRAVPQGVVDYLARVRTASSLPVCAGFGVRTPEQVAALAPHADGVIVGTALVEAIERGDDPAAFLGALREAA